MYRRFAMSMLCAVISGAPSLGDEPMTPTVSLELSSPWDGEVIHLGQGCIITAVESIEWTVTATVSTGDNQRLALISVDLVQDTDNRQLFDLPPADGVPEEMEGFATPGGIGNPGAYGGTQVGDAGQMDLAQIAGAQNTFGVAGTGMGLDINVDGGVGHNGQIIASGALPVPDTCGDYTFSIQNAVANVLDSVHAPPTFSPVSQANIVYTAQTITFRVCMTGDINCSGYVNVTDFNLFSLAWLSKKGEPNYDPRADLDCDGRVNFTDYLIFSNYWHLHCV